MFIPDGNQNINEKILNLAIGSIEILFIFVT